MNGHAAAAQGVEVSMPSGDFRLAMGQFATGVAVVTVGGPYGPYGTTINSLTSVSLAPPLLLICLDSRARGAAVVAASREFTVNILAAQQELVARRFADRRRETGGAAFADVPHRLTSSGAPVLTDALAHLDCLVEQEVCAGDHTIFLGRVTHVTVADGSAPLTFFRGQLVTPE